MNSLYRFLTISVLAAFANSASGDARPNIIMIMVDDLDRDLFAHLLQQKTLPRIQQDLIDAGVSFDNFFVTNPICCPSRATYLTGQYSHNHGILSVQGAAYFSFGLDYWIDEDGTLPNEANTLPVWVRAAGYETAHIGKYLNGYGWDTKPEHVPAGYDQWHGLVDLSTYRMFNFRINHNGKITKYGESPDEYQTDVLARLTTDAISKRMDPSKPFFFAVMPSAPHIEHFLWKDTITFFWRTFFPTIRPAPRHSRLTDGEVSNGELEAIPGKRNRYQESLTGKPEWVRDKSPLSRQDREDLAAQYLSRASSMIAVDDLVGSIIDKLKEVDQLDRTIIYFTSDNGWFHGEFRLSQKSLAYDEASRVPLVVRGPGYANGKIVTSLTANIDLAPTVVEQAGASAQRAIDGRSLMPLLVDPEYPWPRKHVLIEAFQVKPFTTFLNPETYAALRTESETSSSLYTEWYEEYIGGRTMTDLPNTVTFRELYDLREDPLAVTNIWHANQGEGSSDHEVRLLRLRSCAGDSCRKADRD